VLALTLVGVAYLRRKVVQPVTAVAGATQAVAAGDLSTRVAVTSDDEIGTLERGFNSMTNSLERSHAQLEERTAELERSNRDLEDFASVASHDLQGPLATIVMFADSLGNRLTKRDDLDDAKLARHISTAAADLRTLVRDLLAYSKLGRRALELRPVELDEVVRKALDILAAPIETARAEIVTEPLPVVNGDAGRLCQVMQNLISNAVKFSERGGDQPRVMIRSERDDGQWRISVSDNGIGFDPDEADRIFRPFHRLHSTDAYDGSGIGLAICERIITQHGGRIWADSRKGAGATFHIALPAGAVQEQTAAPEPALA
jgi:light-regulated signal transduction histidine kinase (bacteriophytochrome)